MAYYDTIYLVQGDTLPELNLTLKDSNSAAMGMYLDEDDSSTWAPIDISAATVRLKFRALGTTEIKSTITFNKHAPYNEGRVYAAWPAEALDTAGTFTGEVEIEYDNGKIQTVYDQLKFKVRGEY